MPYRPTTLPTDRAIFNVASDYMRDRTAEDRESFDELCAEAVAHACMVLGVENPDTYDMDEYGDLLLELEHEHEGVSDDARSDGRAHHFNH